MKKNNLKILTFIFHIVDLDLDAETYSIVYFFVTYFIKLMNILQC